MTAPACNGCGAPLAPQLRFCSSCGKTQHLSKEESLALRRDLEARQRRQPVARSRAALWSPHSAAAASLVLTPLFGATLTALNWRVLGNEVEYRFAQSWALGALLVLLAPTALGAAGLGGEWFERSSRIGAYVYLGAWYVFSARRQARYLGEHFTPDYPRRSLLKAAGVALLMVAGIIASYFAMGILDAAL